MRDLAGDVWKVSLSKSYKQLQNAISAVANAYVSRC